MLRGTLEPTTRPEKAALAHRTCPIPMMVNSCPSTPTFPPATSLGSGYPVRHWGSIFWSSPGWKSLGNPLSSSPSHTHLSVVGSRWYLKVMSNIASAQLLPGLAAKVTLPGNLQDTTQIKEGSALGFLLWQLGPAQQLFLRTLPFHLCSPL